MSPPIADGAQPLTMTPEQFQQLKAGKPVAVFAGSAGQVKVLTQDTPSRKLEVLAAGRARAVRRVRAQVRAPHEPCTWAVQRRPERAAKSRRSRVAGRKLARAPGGEEPGEPPPPDSPLGRVWRLAAELLSPRELYELAALAERHADCLIGGPR